MRLAVIASGSLPVLDGVTVGVHERLRRAQSRGHQTLLLAPSADPQTVPAGSIGLTSRPWGDVDGDRNPTRKARGEIDRALAAFGPDLIQVEEPERLFLGLWQAPALRFARARGIPIVAVYHTNFIDYAPDLWPTLPAPLLRLAQRPAWRALMALYNRYDATFVPSLITCRRLEAKGLRNGLCVLLNGVDTCAFTPALRRPGYWTSVWGLPDFDRRWVILILGRLTPDKGWLFWSKALPALGTRFGKRVAVAVAGDGVLRPEVERLLQNADIDGACLGKVSRHQAAELMANATVFVTASLRENASLAVLEALASGVPVVAPRAGGLPDQVDSPDKGLLFEPGKVADFLDVIASVIDSDRTKEAKNRATAGRRDGLDWEAAVDAWLDALNSVVSRVR